MPAGSNANATCCRWNAAANAQRCTLPAAHRLACYLGVVPGVPGMAELVSAGEEPEAPGLVIPPADDGLALLSVDPAALPLLEAPELPLLDAPELPLP